MYGWTSRKRRPRRPEEHSGTWRDFLKSHESECRRLRTGNRKGVAALIGRFLSRIRDERNLFAALDHLVHEGGQAPGPNDLKYQDLADDPWQVCRVLRDVIDAGQYAPGPEKFKSIPKASGDGTRTITLQNIEDRIVQRAALQIVQPRLDTTFDQHSFGYRPRRDRRHALATARFIAESQCRWFWVVADIRTAFDAISIGRLRDVLAKRLTDRNLVEFLSLLLDRGTRRGIRQGGALSPLALNIYLDYHLDNPWRKTMKVPLIRYADDMLLLCRTAKGARQAYANLQKRMRDIGLPLKEPETNPVVDLRTGMPVHWLGYTIGHEAGEIRVHLDESTWDTLDEQLADAVNMPAASLRATDAIRGWVQQAGPAWPRTSGKQEAILRRIHQLALDRGLDEVPSMRELSRSFSASHRAWSRISRDIQIAEAGHPGHKELAPLRSPSSQAQITQSVTIYTDGCCLFPERVGGCAWIVQYGQTGTMSAKCARARRTTNNRMELIAVIRALECLRVPSRVLLRIDSRYVTIGITDWLKAWKANGWYSLSRKSKPVKNRELWERLDSLLNRHAVQVEWIPAHSGEPFNEKCDQLSKWAATRIAS